MSLSFGLGGHLAGGGGCGWDVDVLCFSATCFTGPTDNVYRSGGKIGFQIECAVVLGFSGETEQVRYNIHIYIKRFIIWYGLTGLQRLRGPIICSEQTGDPKKLPVCSLKFWELERWWHRCQRRRATSQLKQSGRENRIQPSSAFLLFSGPPGTGWYPASMGRAICFTQSPDSGANFFWRHPQWHTQK